MNDSGTICIGINGYENLQPLEQAQSDAETLKNFFDRNAGFGRIDYFAEGAPPMQKSPFTSATRAEPDECAP